MKALPWLLLALVALLVVLDRHRIPAASVQPVRDSVRLERAAANVRHDTVIQWLARAPADTLGPILRALARRPTLVIRDTAWLPLADFPSTAMDTGSIKPCEVLVSCQEARRLIARDTSWAMVLDSLRGDLGICAAEKDSMAHYSPSRTLLSGIPTGAAIGVPVTLVAAGLFWFLFSVIFGGHS